MLLRRRFQLALAFCVSLFSVSASAVNIEMTARFRPDPAKPFHNVFENTTPQGGYCKDHPSYCQNGVFSIGLPIRFRSVAPIQPLHDVRQGPMFRVPSSWKELIVVNDNTGERETVEMRVKGIGAAYTLKDPLPNGVWQYSWVYAPAPCEYGGVGYGNAHYYAFFWQVPPNAGVCAKQAQKLIPESLNFAYQDVGFSYELKTPEPLKMSAGTYRGVLSYSVGPYKDFDLGDVMLPDDGSININFTLSVEHTLKVDIPPGGEKVQLVPAGGWQGWLHGGRKPVRLFRDQTFNISASSRFKMFLQCSITDGRVCFMADRDRLLTAPLKVSVSLPGGLTDSAGRPVQRQELVTDGGAVSFQPGHYVDRQPGTLHFELEQPDHFFLPGAPKQYFGGVTVVWDSEV